MTIPKSETRQPNQTKNGIRPKLLNFEFCRIKYSSDVFFALADRNSSIFKAKSVFLGTSSWVKDLVSLSFCSMASCTWLARTGMVLSLEVLVLSSRFRGGRPATGGLWVNLELNIFILSESDNFAGSSSSNLAATGVWCVFTYILCVLCAVIARTFT